MAEAATNNSILIPSTQIIPTANKPRKRQLPMVSLLPLPLPKWPYYRDFV